jgi:glucose/mannose-6-phosphate isomerase
MRRFWRGNRRVSSHPQASPIDRAPGIAYNVRYMPETSLDTPDLIQQLDREGIGARIAALPEQIAHAWAAGRALDLPVEYRDTERIVVLGMGGSGIGGTIMQALAVDLGAKTPVSVVHGYSLPAYVGARTLVLASSNSGNTEETVAALSAAVAAGAKCVAIATGGRIAEIAREHGLPALTFTWDGEPRSALGWSLASLLAISCKAGLLPDLDAELDATLSDLRAYGATLAPSSPESSNPAKQIARRLAGRLPVFVGAEALAPVAYRWRTQVNENSKSWAIADELPEMNHNAQAGYGLPQRAVPLLHVVFLRHAAIHPRIRLRIDAAADEMRRHGVESEVVDIAGATIFAQVLRAAHLGDYVSYYLGLLNGVSPSPTPELTAIKDRLAAHRDTGG